MHEFDRFFNLFHRLHAPSAWSDSSRDVVRNHLSRGKRVHRLTINSNVDEMTKDEIQEHYCALENVIRELQGVPVYLSSGYSSSDKEVRFRKMVFQVGQNHLEAELMDRSMPPNSIQVDISGHSHEGVERVLDALRPWVREAPAIKTTSRIYAVVSSKDGVSIRSIGKTEVVMEPGNYDLPVVESYRHIVDCLASDDPCGRFCLFDGPPGTGKSYLIRSLIHTLDAVFVLVPSSMIGGLSGPSLVSSFLHVKTHGKPLILILEDADVALVSRKVSRGSAAAMAELLNLGDGLLGEVLDMRIVATTNAERIELDPAVTRPGRMCTHLTLGELPTSQLATIYNRITGSDRGPALVKKSQATTLAEVYRLARDSAWAAKAVATDGSGTYL